MNLETMRHCMSEMATNEALNECMYEVMQQEGFLPESLEEGDTYEGHCAAMLEDDDICKDMYESIMSSQNECGSYLREWINENWNESTEMDEDMADEIHTRDHALDHMRHGEPNPGADKYMSEDSEEEDEVMVNEEPEGHMSIAKLHEIQEFVEKILDKIQPDADLEPWIQDKITMSYQNLAGVALYYEGEEISGVNTPETAEHDVMVKPEFSLLGLAENELPKFTPKKGKNVDAENKKSSKESKDGMKAAEDSQKTVQQKAEDRVNYKFNPDMESDHQKDIDKQYLGAFNNLNLDFQNDVPKSYKDRVEMEVKTGHSRKRDVSKVGEEANVDHESTKKTGEAIINASIANQGERDSFFKPNPLMVTDEPYEETSITGKSKGGKKKPGGGDLNEKIDRHIERMRKLF
jgi:hypothetical protein